MKTKGAILLVIIGILIVSAGCTRKNNPTGTSNSDLQPFTLTLDSSWLTRSFVYQDTSHNTGGSGSFTVGRGDNGPAIALLRFNSFSEVVTVDSCALMLKIEDRTSTPETFTIQASKVLQTWNEDEITNVDAEDDVPWTDPRFETLEGWTADTTDSDTLYIPLPVDLVQGWIDGDTLNFGIALSLANEVNGFCQFHSQDGSFEPRLEVYYTNTSELADTISYYVSADAYIVDGEPLAGELPATYISNNIPTRLYTCWDISLDAFNANLPANISAFADSTELRRTTVNRAELIVPVDSTLSWIPEDAFRVYSYLVRDSVVVDSLPLASADLKSFAYTDVGSYADGVLTIDYTPVVQSLLAGFDDNHGFVAISLQENFNTGTLQIPDLATGAVLRMVLTKPIIGDEE